MSDSNLASIPTSCNCVSLQKARLFASSSPQGEPSGKDTPLEAQLSAPHAAGVYPSLSQTYTTVPGADLSLMRFATEHFRQGQERLMCVCVSVCMVCFAVCFCVYNIFEIVMQWSREGSKYRQSQHLGGGGGGGGILGHPTLKELESDLQA